jgi:glycosyltransferase involved in cell wall biosynthesis
VFSALAHGLLLMADTVDRVVWPSSDAGTAGSLDEDVSLYIARAWQQDVGTLGYSPVTVGVREVPAPPMTDLHRAWLLDRPVTGPDGRRRVIFVLNATTISGGIKVVFEEAEGLAGRGYDVEIWSLQGQPDWTELAIPVTTFRSYFDMLRALRSEDAIKVATWWETQQVVLLGSAVRGIPVSYIMEFESWFYPTQPLSQAAVAASYRPEFHNVTIASYQQQELAEVGVSATLIPVGFDPRLFRTLKRVKRRDDAVLALGRTFFQKNFALTEKAWKSLGDQRPTLLLFGYEPDMLVDERVEYTVRPSHSEANELYNTAAAFIQTSLHEGFGLPVIEAMAAGCPVITTDSHGNRDFCFDGENCLVVEQGDVEGLAAAITRVLGDAELRKRLSAAGLETAERYRWPVIFDELADYYSRVS